MVKKSVPFIMMLVNVVPNLHIPEFTGPEFVQEHLIDNPSQTILYSYHNYPSIINVKEYREYKEIFLFSFGSESDTWKLIRALTKIYSLNKLKKI